jgi:2-oxoglutarate dehydrogenase E2 component (dihydrolipoamide succinyltransferase)
MAFSVQMPALGESVTEGTVTRWLKQEGDRVEVDEPLLEVSTDKVDTEIPSPAAGVLQKIVAQEDDTVEVGGELAVIGDSDGGSSEPAPAPAQESAPEPQETSQQTQPSAAPAEAVQEAAPAAAPATETSGTEA